MPNQNCTLCDEGQSCELCSPYGLGNNQFQLSEFLSRNAKNNKILTYYSFRYTGINYSYLNTSVLVAISKQLAKKRDLRTLIMDDKTYGVRTLEWTKEGTPQFVQSIKDHPSLNSLTLEMNSLRLYEEEDFAVLDCLTGAAVIRQLKIIVYGNYDVFLNGLGKRLQSRDSIEEIDLDIESPDQRKTPSPITEFIQGIARQRNLRKLSLFDPSLENYTKSLAEALSHTPHLEVLSLSLDAYHWGKLPLNEIIPVVVRHRNLTELDLHQNGLVRSDFEPLSKLLPSLPLAVINLSGNKHLKDSMDCVVSFITNISSLRGFVFKKCELEDQHFAPLVPVLKDFRKCQLDYIDCHDNALTRATYVELQNALLLNKWLNINIEPHSDYPAFRRNYKIDLDPDNARNYQNTIQRRLSHSILALAQGHAPLFSQKKRKASFADISDDMLLTIFLFVGLGKQQRDPVFMFQYFRKVLADCNRRKMVPTDMQNNVKKGVEKGRAYDPGTAVGKWVSQDNRKEPNLDRKG